MRLQCSICGIYVSSVLINKEMAWADLLRKQASHLEANHKEVMQDFAETMVRVTKIISELAPFNLFLNIPVGLEGNTRIDWLDERMYEKSYNLLEELGMADVELLESMVQLAKDSMDSMDSTDDYGEHGEADEAGGDVEAGEVGEIEHAIADDDGMAPLSSLPCRQCGKPQDVENCIEGGLCEDCLTKLSF